jgi:hypothetical protein
VATPYQFGEFEGGEQTRPAACTVCETMLPEAVDGLLTAEEQRAFDTHVAGCVECSRELAEAQRGAAWLGMLKTKSPEPPATLLARILAETTGAAGHATAVDVEAAPAFVPPAFVPTYDPLWAPRAAATPAGVWATRWATGWASVRQMSGLFSSENARSTFQPRMAMTAAMAFFSIALTLNLTGVRLRDLRAENFTPAGIQRTVADTTADLTRSFQNNRSVYQVESRLSELRDEDGPPPEGRSDR